jgi:hypothetical protein
MTDSFRIPPRNLSPNNHADNYSDALDGGIIDAEIEVPAPTMTTLSPTDATTTDETLPLPHTAPMTPPPKTTTPRRTQRIAEENDVSISTEPMDVDLKDEKVVEHVAASDKTAVTEKKSPGRKRKNPDNSSSSRKRTKKDHSKELKEVKTDTKTESVKSTAMVVASQPTSAMPRTGILHECPGCHLQSFLHISTLPVQLINGPGTMVPFMTGPSSASTLASVSETVPMDVVTESKMEVNKEAKVEGNSELNAKTVAVEKKATKPRRPKDDETNRSPKSPKSKTPGSKPILNSGAYRKRISDIVQAMSPEERNAMNGYIIMDSKMSEKFGGYCLSADEVKMFQNANAWTKENRSSLVQLTKKHATFQKYKPYFGVIVKQVFAHYGVLLGRFVSVDHEDAKSPFERTKEDVQKFEERKCLYIGGNIRKDNSFWPGTVTEFALKRCDYMKPPSKEDATSTFVPPSSTPAPSPSTPSPQTPTPNPSPRRGRLPSPKKAPSPKPKPKPDEQKKVAPAPKSIPPPTSVTRAPTKPLLPSQPSLLSTPKPLTAEDRTKSTHPSTSRPSMMSQIAERTGQQMMEDDEEI